MVCAKVFMRGNSYAVRVPKEFHIDNTELFSRRLEQQ